MSTAYLKFYQLFPWRQITFKNATKKILKWKTKKTEIVWSTTNYIRLNEFAKKKKKQRQQKQKLDLTVFLLLFTNLNNLLRVGWKIPFIFPSFFPFYSFFFFFFSFAVKSQARNLVFGKSSGGRDTLPRRQNNFFIPSMRETELEFFFLDIFFFFS